ncbi:ATP-binding protein [Pseudoflavitalea rhizosphaerae]|uniref:ATP-binding protein n=1 Tax=Pseudoflavitalea rhizosphaerae TaxID=1884793 RepID=UPI000F8C307C|nr:ATP-binding protein [Pseudoflavitalea rhizosphaerae]
MNSIEDVQALMKDLESDRIERTISFREDKLGPAVCAFSNDFPNHKKPGYILLGVNDDGTIANIKIGDDELQKIGNVKANGNVLPQPSISVSPIHNIDGGQVVVVQVNPSRFPPVRYDGRCWIRVGPRKAKASVEEERILIERRASYAKTYDLVPALGSNITDISIEHFKLIYLPLAIDQETLAENGRTVEEQMAALRFYDLKENCPTNGGVLMFGINPLFQIPGAYIQYVKFNGVNLTDDVVFNKEFSGALISELPVLDDFIKNNVIKGRPERTGSFQELNIQNYPYWALRELIMNAVMHRNYESNSPILIYEFDDRIEITNPGGLYGDVTIANFPNASDYRNVVIAESMKRLGYVNRFNYGVKRAINELQKNGNGEPDFDLKLTTKFKVTIPINQNW